MLRLNSSKLFLGVSEFIKIDREISSNDWELYPTYTSKNKDPELEPTGSLLDQWIMDLNKYRYTNNKWVLILTVVLSDFVFSPGRGTQFAFSYV